MPGFLPVHIHFCGPVFFTEMSSLFSKANEFIVKTRTPAGTDDVSACAGTMTAQA